MAGCCCATTRIQGHSPAERSIAFAPGIDAHVDEFKSYVEIAQDSEEFEIVYDSEEGKPDVVAGGVGGCSCWQHSVQGAGGRLWACSRACCD